MAGLTQRTVADRLKIHRQAISYFENNTRNPYTVEKGDKISQLVILPICSDELEVVDSLDETARGNNGFGSSGR